MCTGMCGARCGLLTCNIILMLIALTCIAGGVVLILGRGAYGDGLQFLRNDLSTSAAQIRGDNKLNVSELDVTFITLPLGVVLLIFGVLIAAMCILGIIAASGHFYKFVIVYMVLSSLLFFAQVVVIICVYIDKKPFDSTVKRLLKKSLEKYTDINGEDSFTLGWNAVMSYKQCCGVDDYGDFSIAGYPKSVKSGTSTYQAVTPQICCIKKAGSGACVEQNNFQQMTFYKYGCYEHIWDYVTSETGLIISAVFFIVLLEFLCLFFSLWVCCSRNKMGMSKVSNYE